MQANIKLLIFALLFANLQIFTFSNCQAQVPQKFNYQGIARDAKGNPMSQQRMTLKLTILPASDAIEGEYEEIQTVTTNEFGLYTLQIGNGSSLKGEMSAVKWETGNKYIKVAIDPKGGSDYVDAGTNQLLSVPYAIYADKAGMAKSTASSERSGTVSTSASGTGTVNYLTKFTAANTIYNSQLFDNGTNIGIGTSSPLYKFHIQSATGNSDILIRSMDSSAISSLRLRNSAGAEFGINKFGPNATGTFMGISRVNMAAINNFVSGPLVLNSGGDVAIGNTVSNTQVARIFVKGSTGNVGIGTTNPSTKLEVVGQVKITGGSPGVGKVLTSDASGLATWQTPTGGGGNVASGNSIGDMMYWNGSNWIVLPVGVNGQTLTLVNGLPTWQGGVNGGMATVSTTSISSISNVSCTIGGDVTNNGGSTVMARGFVYNTSPNPTLANMFVQAGSGLGGFSSAINGLVPGTTYYIRAYASNATGTNYGNQVTFNTTSNTPYTIGLPGPAGGFVFYDKGSYTNGWRYLEAAPYDQSNGVVWGCNPTLIGNTGTQLGDGYNNSVLILSGCTSSNIAASICDTAIINSFSDWYLPSFYELDLMYDNLYLMSIGNFTLNRYWSSSEYNSTSAYYLDYANGSWSTSNHGKNNLYKVRAIRRF